MPRVLVELGRDLGDEDAGDASVEQGVPGLSESSPSPPPLAAGERVGRFQVERLVGEGAMGTVYAARDPELGRAVALKLLRVRTATGEDSGGSRNRLLREAQAMAPALPAAQEKMEVALGVFRERSGEAAALANLVIIQQRQYQLAMALQRSGEAIAVYRETGDRRGVASTLSNRGGVLRDQGDLEGARRSFEQSLAGYRELGLKDRQASPLIGLGYLAVDREDLAQAQELFREAKELQAPGEKVWTSVSLLGLAHVAFKRDVWMTPRAWRSNRVGSIGSEA